MDISVEMAFNPDLSKQVQKIEKLNEKLHLNEKLNFSHHIKEKYPKPIKALE